MLTIVGAGMAGLLAANMLRRHHPMVLERQKSLPNNHSAVLRFRTQDVANQLHIAFKEVLVFKACDEADPIKAAMQYSQKVLGRYEVRSLINLDPVARYIAPPNLIEQMGQGIAISFDCEYEPMLPWSKDEVVISTMPMEALMDALVYQDERPDFISEPGWTITATLTDCDAFMTRYYSRPACRPYRASITGNRLIVEGTRYPPADFGEASTILMKAALDFGLTGAYVDGDSIQCRESQYSKIAHLSADDRRKANAFMFWATTNHNVYSLGRFATWRAGLLLDDLVNDIIKIERWISTGAYELKRAL